MNAATNDSRVHLRPLSSRVSGQSDGPTVVFLHGYISSSSYWDATIDQAVSRGYRTVTIDLLGFGKSYKPKDSDYSLDEHASAVIETLHMLNIRDFILVGHSMGAIIAARVNLEKSFRINKTILLNMPIFTSPEQAHSAFIGTNLLYKLVIDRSLDRLVWPLARVLIKSPLRFLLNEDLQGILKSSIYHTAHSRRLSLINTIEKVNGINLLKTVGGDVELVQGLLDRAEYLDNIREYQAELPSNINISIVGGAHHTMVTNPDFVLSLLGKPSDVV